MTGPDDLQFLLDFNGAAFAFESGYWIRIKARVVKADATRPHGIDYSLTLHEPGGRRILGFDNAHAVAAPGSRFKRLARQRDHWHRTDSDPGRPYVFVDAPTLIADFFAEAERALAERGIAFVVPTTKTGASHDES